MKHLLLVMLTAAAVVAAQRGRIRCRLHGYVVTLGGKRLYFSGDTG